MSILRTKLCTNDAVIMTSAAAEAVSQVVTDASFSENREYSKPIWMTPTVTAMPPTTAELR